MKTTKDQDLAIEVQTNGTRNLKRIGRIRNGIVLFDETVPKGATGRIIPAAPLNSEVEPS